MNNIKTKILKIELSKLSESSRLMMLFIIFIVGNIIFFLSPFFMQLGKLSYTEFNTPFLVSNMELEIIKWDFDKKNNKMEVVFETSMLQYSADTFAFKCLTKPSKKITVDKIIDENNYLVVHLSNVPENFTEVSLHIMLDGSKTRIYTNKNKVRYNDNIEIKTLEGYYIEQHEINREFKLNKINEIEEKINDCRKNIVTYTKNIDDLNSTRKFKTSEQIIEIDKEISEYDKVVNSEENNIILKQNEIMQFKADIKEIELKIIEIKTYYLGSVYSRSVV